MADISEEIASSKEINMAMQNIFTKEFYSFLYKYGIVRLKVKFDIQYDIQRGIGGILLEDLIHETVIAFIEGKRKWYKNKFPNYRDQLISAFDSVIYNSIVGLKDINKNFSINQTISLSDDMGNNYNELIKYCERELKDLGATDEEILIFEPYIIHGTKRQVIAELLEISEEQVTNIKKRLVRKLPIIREKLRNLIGR